MQKMLKAGADKVAINSSAVANPELIKQGAEKFSNQCIVVAIDAKAQADGTFHVYINGGQAGCTSMGQSCCVRCW